MVVIKEQLEFIVLVYSGWTLPHSNVHYMFFCNKKHWLSYILFNLQIMVLLMKLLQDPLWWQYIDNLMSTLLTFQTSFFFLKNLWRKIFNVIHNCGCPKKFNFHAYMYIVLELKTWHKRNVFSWFATKYFFKGI